jgi:hypothetical protein
VAGIHPINSSLEKAHLPEALLQQHDFVCLKRSVADAKRRLVRTRGSRACQRRKLRCGQLARLRLSQRRLEGPDARTAAFAEYPVNRAHIKAAVVQRGLDLKPFGGAVLTVEAWCLPGHRSFRGRRRAALALARLGTLVDDDAAHRAADQPADQPVCEIRRRPRAGHDRDAGHQRRHDKCL